MPRSRRVVLASSSPRRRELLAQLGLEPEVCPPRVDERPREGETADELVRRLAEAKLEAVVGDLLDDPAEPSSLLVIAADTVVVCDDEILAKPTDRDDAARMLRGLRGRSHRVVTGMAASWRAGVGTPPVTEVLVVAAEVTFRSFSERALTWYLDTGEWDGKAGAYAIQGHAAGFVSRVDGEYTTVVGLPVATLAALLDRWRID